MFHTELGHLNGAHKLKEANRQWRLIKGTEEANVYMNEAAQEKPVDPLTLDDNQKDTMATQLFAKINKLVMLI